MDLQWKNTSLGEPKLPPELEREIFEIAAVSHPTTIPTLMLKAGRVRDWIEPLLYRIVMITSSRRRICGFSNVPLEILLQVITIKPPSFLEGIKYLLLADTFAPSSVRAILAACRGVRHLMAHSHVPLTSHLNSLADLRCLTRLTVHIEELFPRTIDFTHPLFRNVTHLELFDFPLRLNTSHALCIGLPLIPNLTHFAFNGESLTIDLRPILSTTLSHLQCVAAVTQDADLEGMDAAHTLSDDERFVCIGQTNYYNDWVQGAIGGEDFWAIAEAFITRDALGKSTVLGTVFPIEMFREEFNYGPRARPKSPQASR
ncbi:hypothetical protein B0H19DRAFT_1151724 [Mycena capillaripes]|nr:hypothetical protein B0H19DRAFT_1151724 [Mycena capillaripes]